MNMSKSVGNTHTTDHAAVTALYQQLLDAWNRRNAMDYAALFEDSAHVTGFDGSQMDGRKAIEAEISRIFTHHQTAAYVGIIRDVRFLAPEVAILLAVVGMIPPGQKDLNPATNAIQSMVAIKQGDGWRITHFQNTPAQFHGRPELAEALTEELKRAISP